MRPVRHSSSPAASTYYDRHALARLRWQLLPGYIQQRERDLLDLVAAAEDPEAVQASRRVLEVGCGGGANLANGRWGRASLVGMDLSYAAVGAGKGARIQAAWVCADAAAPPFRHSSFDVVFCRDLLHHLGHERWDDFLREAKRVLTPTGRLVVVESNARNPLVWCQALALAEERGQLHSGPEEVRRLLLRGGFRIEWEGMRDPFPLALALFNFRLPWAWTVAYRPIGAMLKVLDVCATWLLPKHWWAYYTATARPSDQPSETTLRIEHGAR